MQVYLYLYIYILRVELCYNCFMCCRCAKQCFIDSMHVRVSFPFPGWCFPFKKYHSLLSPPSPSQSQMTLICHLFSLLRPQPFLLFLLLLVCFSIYHLFLRISVTYINTISIYRYIQNFIFFFFYSIIIMLVLLFVASLE